MDLKLSVLVHLDSGGMDYSQVSDVVLSILRKNHELRLPQLLIVAEDVVIAVTLSNLELSQVAIKLKFKVLQLLSINISKLQIEIVLLFRSGFD